MYTIDTDALLRTHPGDPLGTIPMIGYIRVSTAREEMISPDIQADAVHRWAATNRRRIVRWIADLDLSGRTLDKRQISQIIDSIATRTAPDSAREIGVWKYSRFGRNRADNALSLARLERAGGALISATELVDARTAVGRLTRGMLMELAAFESDLIGENWRDAQAHRVAQGLPNSGRPRFGYARKGRVPRPDDPHKSMPDPDDPQGGRERYEVDPVWGPVLAEMYRRAADGQSTNEICRWLNSLGAPGPRGTRPWSYGNLWRLLDTGFGMGLLYVHDPQCADHNPDKRGHCKNRTHIPGAHHSVFDPHGDDPVGAEEGRRVWEAYLQRRGKRQPSHGQTVRGAPKHDLTGRIRCGWCGHSMTAHRNTSRGRRLETYSWRCQRMSIGLCDRTNSVSDRLVRQGIRDLLARERDRLAALDGGEPHPVHAPAQVEDPAEAIRRRLDSLGARLDRLTEGYTDGLIPADSYQRTRDRYLEERRSLEAELAEATAPAPRQPVDYVPVIIGLVEEWDTLSVASRNRLVGELLPEIRAYRHSVTEAYVVVRTAWGAEERIWAAEPMGRPRKGQG